MYGCGKDCLILVPFRRPQISCFIISLIQTIAPMWGSDPCFSSLPPPPPRAGTVLLTLLFFPPVPLSYRVLRGSIHTFPLARCSCLLSAGVLHVRVGRCIPDVSVERDVLHVHLLPCHFVLKSIHFQYSIPNLTQFC